MTTREMWITTEEFESYIRKPECLERRFELIDGEIVEKAMPTREHGQIAALFSYFFIGYFEEHPSVQGNVAVEARHRPTGDHHNDRLPDVSVVLGTKLPVKRGVEDYIPDICIEIQSPDGSLTKMRAKALFYLENGAKYALVVTTVKPTIEVYTADEVLVLQLGDTLTFGDLLPGFSIPVARFFPATEK